MSASNLISGAGGAAVRVTGAAAVAELAQTVNGWTVSNAENPPASTIYLGESLTEYVDIGDLRYFTVKLVANNVTSHGFRLIGAQQILQAEVQTFNTSHNAVRQRVSLDSSDRIRVRNEHGNSGILVSFVKLVVQMA